MNRLQEKVLLQADPKLIHQAFDGIEGQALLQSLGVNQTRDLERGKNPMHEDRTTETIVNPNTFYFERTKPQLSQEQDDLDERQESISLANFNNQYSFLLKYEKNNLV